MKTINRNTECKECKKKGLVVFEHLSDGEYEVTDYIQHRRGCSLRPKQARHFFKRRTWQRGEERGNALVGASNTAASGSANMDGDGRVLKEWRVETKTTKKESFRLTKDVWEKVHDGGMSCSEEPLLYVETSLFQVVITRSQLHNQKMSSISSAPKSLLINMRIANILNEEENRNGVIIDSWKGSPVIQLKRYFTNERRDN